MAVASSPTEQLLELLDEVMDRLKAAPLPSHKENDTARGEALGLAKAISILSFMSVDQVREYAVYRWDARNEGLEAMSTLEWAGLR